MNIFKMLARKLLGLVQLIVRIFSRALCCFRRRRLSSQSESTPLTNIDVIGDRDIPEQSWDEWKEEKEVRLNATEQQILLYRQERSNHAKTEEEPAVDFFVDMTPKIVRQQKILLPSEKTQNNAINSFSLAPDPVYHSAELGTWEEKESWEAETDVDVTSVMKEKKRQERERRLLEQQRRKLERIRPEQVPLRNT